MDGKNLYCLGIHFKSFYEQGSKNKGYDSCEPCHICKYNKACKFQIWDDMQKQLKKETGICIDHHFADE